MSRVGALALIAALALGAAACSKEKDKAGEAKAKPAVPVTTAAVVRKTMPVRIEAVGTVEPSTVVAVKAQIDGQITAVRFTDGQAVQRGQMLFELDDRALQAQVRELQAHVQRDRALAENQSAREQRYQDLRRKGFVSDDAYQQVRTDLEAARATLAADEAALAQARVQLSYTRITAAVSGRAGRAQVQIGNLVKANDTTALTTIHALTPIFVGFPVPEQQLPAIRAAMAKRPLPVAVAPTDGAPPVTDGRLTFIDNTVDARSGTVRLRATFANRDEALWPGQFARVVLTLMEQPDAVVVPAEAVQNGPKGQYVYAVKADGLAELRPVRIDRTEGGEAVVASGLAGGETVVTSGQIRVTPGAKVAVKKP